MTTPRIFHAGSPQPDDTVQAVRYDDDTPVVFRRHRFDDGDEWQAQGHGGNGSLYSWSEINDGAVLVDATAEYEAAR